MNKHYIRELYTQENFNVMVMSILAGPDVSYVSKLNIPEILT